MGYVDNSRLRLGIVGSGLVSHWHNSGIRLSNSWDLIAGALSSKPDKAKLLGQEWMLDSDRTYTSYKQMAEEEALRSDGIHAVAICTPNDTHRSIAEVFMQNGIDVICDKPVANTLEDGMYLASLQKETGLVLAVTHPYAYHPMVRQAREMIKAGAIGGIRQFMIEYVQEWAGYTSGSLQSTAEKTTEPWRKDPERAGRTSTTGDIGTHAYHLLEYVCNDPVVALSADFHVCGPERELEDTAFINMRLDSGAPGVLWLSQVAAGEHCGLRFRVYGDKGSLKWDQEYPEQLRFSKFDEPEQIILRGQGGGMYPEAERMTRLPRGHGESLSDAWSGLYTEIAELVRQRRSGAIAHEGNKNVPDIHQGVRGIRFVHAAADSHEAGGVWINLP